MIIDSEERDGTDKRTITISNGISAPEHLDGEIDCLTVVPDDSEQVTFDFKGISVRELCIVDCKEGSIPNLTFTKCSIRKITRSDDEEDDGFVVNGELLVDDCHIREIDFNNTVFKEKFTIIRCKIDNTVFMSGSTFEKDCSFVECSMPYCVLQNCDFKNLLDFKSSKFDKLTNLKNASIGTLNLSDASVLQEIDLSGIEKNSGFRICMNDFFIRGMVKTTFQSMMNTEGRYRKLGYREPVLYWMDRHMTDRPYLPPEHRDGCREPRTFRDDALNSDGDGGSGTGANLSNYTALKQIMEDNEEFNIADTILMLKKRRERPKLEGYRKFVSYASDLFGGYGMKPSYTLAMMVFVVLMFSVIFLAAGGADSCMTPQDSIISSVAALFSIDMNTLPNTTLFHALSLTESIIGFMLLLYFTVIVTRKIVR